ncbi:hypothetical protein VIGAN_11009600 [Vigna angularis var. angularis]|uniref:Uncharacterized protein n=1 Tax=Vigna angularis var. angularis TaxID=157739 RepID=A0A0S3T6Y4_PHAAN|nr:hypothetical protein VIGAN_11009600 [Vigna angularis var. angularis]
MSASSSSCKCLGSGFEQSCGSVSRLGVKSTCFCGQNAVFRIARTPKNKGKSRCGTSNTPPSRRVDVGLPTNVAIEKAFNESKEWIFYRHEVPGSVWKLQKWLQIGQEKKWLQIGQEKKMTEACKSFDDFIYSCIASKREELSKCSSVSILRL